MKFKSGFIFQGALVAILLLLAVALSSCGEESTTTGASADTSSREQGESADSSEAEVLPIGETGATDKAEVTVEKITVTDSLDSPEAAALLTTGEAGEQESYYGDEGTPASGNEFLMVTLIFKNIDAKPPVVNPAGLTLANSEGDEYDEVSTGGYGGVFNMPQVEPGEERQVTAVYEVPEGETGLVLTYQPYGEIACLFQVR